MTRTVKTLLEDFASLNTKKFDLDFTVDPLFKKTCADFDEGGARGLLLNHLSISNQGMIIFDAGDAIAIDEDAETIVNDDGGDISTDLPRLLGAYGLLYAFDQGLISIRKQKSYLAGAKTWSTE